MNNSKRNSKPVIGISVGDINGIGTEIILRVFSDPRIYEYCTPLVFGCKNLVNYYLKVLNIRDLNYEIVRDPKQLNSRKLNILCDWNVDSEIKIEIGKPTESSGLYAYNTLNSAMQALKQKLIHALVTAPINKSNIQSDVFKYPGHSEYLMKESGASSYLMLMVSEIMKMGVVTDHIPLREVSSRLSRELIVEKLRLYNETLVKDFAINKPKIAVLGLNPHAGDADLLGTEESEIIIPAINEAKEKGILAMGPYSADGFFGSQMYYKFDGVLAMYHDQGLAPFKSLVFDKGVNYTAGLPIIRTSPVHGTGFNIAGQGIADENSFREALFVAIQVMKNREQHKEITRDPLGTKLVREKEDL
ncbi:MAG: 4-hydroxythreonine-4-phosphate dehydrogenase PdxA [Bacteroidetes bacterium]|nr:4-hydroxythreonine-4-phosphate dehydrogenase PdxA [Bacteroidota bacterium]